jgi:hypothetical protein
MPIPTRFCNRNPAYLSSLVPEMLVLFFFDNILLKIIYVCLSVMANLCQLSSLVHPNHSPMGVHLEFTDRIGFLFYMFIFSLSSMRN